MISCLIVDILSCSTKETIVVAVECFQYLKASGTGCRHIHPAVCTLANDVRSVPVHSFGSSGCHSAALLAFQCLQQIVQGLPD